VRDDAKVDVRKSAERKRRRIWAMKAPRLIILAMSIWLGLAAAAAQAGVRVGIGIGLPGPYWGGWYPGYPYYPYYYPRPVYVVPPPAVYVAPAATVVQPASPPPAEQPSTPPESKPLPQPRQVQPEPAPPPIKQVNADERRATIDGYLAALTNPTEQVRLDSVAQLGRMKAIRAVDPLAATLAGDQSPAVREAAARALGIIAAKSALPALNRAAQMDTNHDVRLTAKYAVEIIQSK
jgi:hypothetical protein